MKRPFSCRGLWLVGVALALLLASCGVRVVTRAPSAPEPTVIMPTLPPTLTPRPSATPLPPTLTPTVAPVEGFTTTTVNVRREPNTASEVLGRLADAIAVQIVGRDVSGSWYQILYAEGMEGRGWVAAAYIRTTGEPDVPVVGVVAGGGEGGVSGLVTTKVNVRSGPGTGYNSLGLLNPNDVVALTGKNAGGTWLQIVYAGGPEDRGWIAAGYVQAQGVENLPVLTEEGAVIGTGTPTRVPPTPTPTLVPAPDDGDSARSPAVRVTFSPSASRAFSYSGDLSAPQGDAEDWLELTLLTPSDVAHLTLSLSCHGNGDLRVELWQGDEKLTDWGTLNCGGQDVPLTLFRDEPFLFRLRVVGAGQGLLYVSYTLSVRAVP